MTDAAEPVIACDSKTTLQTNDLNTPLLSNA